LFLNKLLRELRIQLSKADMADKQALGARADFFAAQNSKLVHSVVAAVAAVSLQEQEGRYTVPNLKQNSGQWIGVYMG
jgi:hypothetical protein